MLITICILLAVLTIAAANMDPRIAGGRLARTGEFPYQVSIRRSYADIHICGGTVVTRRHVLTAAHCCFGFWDDVLPPNDIRVVAGQIKLRSTPCTTSRLTSKVIIHPDYSKHWHTNDIALLELKDELPLDNYLIDNIPLNNEALPDGTTCTVTGWGVKYFNSLQLSQNLLATEVSILDQEECQKRYQLIDVQLFNGMLCAVNDRIAADSCKGDSGGPLVCKGRLAGIVSTGKGCANSNFPGVYSDVQYFSAWIHNIIMDGKMETSENYSSTSTVSTENVINSEETSDTVGVSSLLGIYVTQILLTTHRIETNSTTNSVFLRSSGLEKESYFIIYFCAILHIVFK